MIEGAPLAGMLLFEGALVVMWFSERKDAEIAADDALQDVVEDGAA